MHTHYATNSTIKNANFIHQLAHMSQSIEVMIAIEGPRPDIDLGTSSPQGEHANHYTNVYFMLYFVTRWHINKLNCIVSYCFIYVHVKYPNTYLIKLTLYTGSSVTHQSHIAASCEIQRGHKS